MPSVSEVKTQLETLGIRPLKQFGQNFLVNDRVIHKIIQTVQSEWKAGDHTLLVEIGPGLGSLTESLLRHEFKPTLIEIDRTFVDLWKNRGADVIEGDALKINWAQWDKEKVLLVSNLPYQISSSIVIEHSVLSPFVRSMILMFQKEVAQRLMAAQQTDAYGLLSVVAQIFWDLEMVLEAGPQDFYPPPQIASRVVLFRRRESGLRAEHTKRFLSFLKQAFAQRRKKMFKNLKAQYTEDVLLAAFQKLNVNSNARTEELKPQELLNLFLTLQGGYGI